MMLNLRNLLTRHRFSIQCSLGVWTLLAISFATRTMLAEPNRAKLSEIKTAMQKFVNDGHLAGAVTVVGRANDVVSVDVVGMQDIVNNVPMRRDTMFRIASMTKPITALGIMQLVDDGKLRVDDPVEKYLPEFKEQMLVTPGENGVMLWKKPSRPIQIRDLLTHTSGMPSMAPAGLGDLYSKRNRTLSEAVLVFSQRPLTFEPGSKWSYCNAGIDTLGRIIEVVSAKAFDDYLQERVFRPLGMKDTTCFPPADKADRIAKIYDHIDGKLVAKEDVIVGSGVGAKYPIPAGGLYSTADDLTKLYQAMLQRGERGGVRVISEASFKTMTQIQTGDLTAGFTPGMGFGYGWAVVAKPEGVTSMLSPGTFGHGGAFGTQAWIDPKRNLFVVLLIQRVGLPNADGSDMRRSLQEIAFDAVRD